MIASVMQPYIFPYIGYWQLVSLSDVFVILDDVNFIKKGFINRNFILNSGESQRFNLELMGASQNKLIMDIDVSSNNKRLLKTFSTNYRAAPQFDSVYPLLSSIFDYEDRNLARFLGYSIKAVCDFLSISTEIRYSSEIEKDESLRGQSRILAICDALSASQYVNPIGGQNLYDSATFKKSGVTLGFLQTRQREYPQFGQPFVSNLSIIDVLMFNSPEHVSEMLEAYELV